MSIPHYIYDYNEKEKILVTTKTVDYGDSIFKKRY